MLFSGLPRGAEPASFKDDDVIPKCQSAKAFEFVVVGGQTNPYHQLANMSYRVSVSIDKWA